ncbi:hypothetical protein AB0F42_28720 [Streptomyces buecherae]
MDPELEAFLPLLPQARLADPVAERANFAALATSVPAPDVTGMDVEDRTVPADPDVARTDLPPARGVRRHRVAARRRLGDG